MLVLEFKVKASPQQQQAIDEAIRIGQFIRNKCLRLWMDSAKEDRVNGASLNKYTKVLADDPETPFVDTLNSMARQSSAERAWASAAERKSLIQKHALSEANVSKVKSILN